MDTATRQETMPPHSVRRLIHEAALEMSARLDDSATVVADAIHEHCAGLQDGMYLATRQSCRANVGLITTKIAERSSPTEFNAPEEALSYARSYVHEGLSFELLTRAYREGEHAYSRQWLEQLHARAHTADELADAIGFVNDWLFSYITTINTPLGLTYGAEHERWIRGAMAMRSEEVRSILAGTNVDVTQTSGRLRYRLDARHLAFVIWRDDGTGSTPEATHDGLDYGEMDRFAAEIADAIGGSSALLLPIGSTFAGWVAIGSQEIELSALPKARGGVRIAFGRAARGLEGFRRTYQEALMARRVAALRERCSGTPTGYAGVALESLMIQDLEEARRFVADEIGPLLDGSDTGRRLAATLEVFLEEESSFVKAARRLGVHENTVAYRVHRTEELLGRRTSERQLELRSALRLAQLLRGADPA